MGKYDKNKFSEELIERIKLSNLEECEFFPKYFTIETCNNCNARCVMCPKGIKGTNKLEIMDNSIFDKIVTELSMYKEWVEMVCLNSDGEPTLDKFLSSRIKKLKDIGIKKVNISTNGQLLTEELSKKLIESGLDDIRISIDAIREESYNKIRKGLDYHTVVENTKNLIRLRDSSNSNMEIRIRMVELKENLEERKEWLEYWNSLVSKNDKVQIMPAHSWSGVVEEEEIDHILFLADRPCVSVFSSMAINYDGKVQLCDSDIEQKYILGDIREQQIKDIWTSNPFERIRQQHFNGQRNEISICRGCDHWSREPKQNNDKL